MGWLVRSFVGPRMPVGAPPPPVGLLGPSFPLISRKEHHGLGHAGADRLAGGSIDQSTNQRIGAGPTEVKPELQLISSEMFRWCLFRTAEPSVVSSKEACASRQKQLPYTKPRGGY